MFICNLTCKEALFYLLINQPNKLVECSNDLNLQKPNIQPDWRQTFSNMLLFSHI